MWLQCVRLEEIEMKLTEERLIQIVKDEEIVARLKKRIEEIKQFAKEEEAEFNEPLQSTKQQLKELQEILGEEK